METTQLENSVTFWMFILCVSQDAKWKKKYKQRQNKRKTEKQEQKKEKNMWL